ncbi:MAG: hypothetical protein ACO23R_18150 [bacterium]
MYPIWTPDGRALVIQVQMAMLHQALFKSMVMTCDLPKVIPGIVLSNR